MHCSSGLLTKLEWDILCSKLGIRRMDVRDRRLKPTFGGHEKFVFRDAWLKKGVDAASQNPAIFNDDEALVILGVGKNMVRSIRHWCLATGSLGDATADRKARGLQPTAFGTSLLGDTGWDPYLEDPGTLWLLHWQLATNMVRGLVWHLVFSAFYEPEFNKKQMAMFVGKRLDQMGVATTQGTIEREIDCCVRTYVPAIRGVSTVAGDESFDCPLADLGLLRFVADDNIYRFSVGPKPTLATPVFGYALLAFLAQVAQTRRTVAIDECIYHEGSPGQIFKLDENSVVEHLEALADLTEGRLRFQETAGLRQIYLDELAADELHSIRTALLNRYYGHD